MKQVNKIQAFTLVELIVVITILAILGTIAFISMQSYSATARDSTRISDLSAMKTSLELFQLDAGKYPDPTDGFVVSYSGSEVWTQGIFGTTTFSNITKLDKIPLDPLTQKEYTYSVTKTRQEYQFAGIVEGDEVTLNINQPHSNPLLRGEGIDGILETNAGDLLATALVTGTYNGQMLKTQNGTNCNILSLPSIVSSEPNTITDLTVILDNESLVYNGYKNLPTNYISSKYKSDGGFMFTSNKIVVYDDSTNCTQLYNPDNNTARIELITNLQQAYSGTLIENEDDITGILNIDLTNTGELDKISVTIVNNDLGGSIAVSSGGSTTTNTCNETTKPANNGHITYTLGVPTSINQAYIQNATNCGYTCTGGYTGINCEIEPIVGYTNIDGSTTPYLSDSANGSVRFSFDSGTVGNGVVKDNVTGLYWQSDGVTQGEKDWNLAKAYCANLELGGYTDWRLPDYTELLSILDLSRDDLYIDTTYFTVEDYHLTFYWSSTSYGVSTAVMENFVNGSINREYKEYNDHSVRCIR